MRLLLAWVLATSLACRRSGPRHPGRAQRQLPSAETCRHACARVVSRSYPPGPQPASNFRETCEEACEEGELVPECLGLVRVWLDWAYCSDGEDEYYDATSARVMLAIVNGERETLEELLNEPNSINFRYRKSSPVFLAACCADLWATEALVEAGLEPSSREAVRALREAASRGRAAVVRALVRAGVDPNAVIDGRAAGAAGVGYQEIRQVYEQEGVVIDDKVPLP